ncbi:unnamed protein product [Durusdinium trenchii]|uniref:Uncharacterized protein n=1 Tax=Durusdinium trenchii TaxID=1381693 RepID=A0ABP0K805_9DINO
MEQEKAKLNKGKDPCMWQGESMQQKNPDGLRWKSGNLGHLGGILDSDASAGAARAVHRTAAASGSLSSRLDSYAFIAPKLKQTETKRTQEFAPESTEVCPEVDSLVHQLATGKGEFFDYVDALNPQVGCVMCMRDLHETALYEGRHEVKVLPCFHSVCAACLQSLLASSDGDAFDCPRCGRRTQKMQALHQYLPNFDMLHDIDGQKVAQSDFLCEECTSGYRAETYCEECIMNLCESCTKQHRRRRATTNHVLVTLVGQGPQGAEVRNIHRAQYCAIHRTSRYELYCEDCERLICNECARHDHQQCSYRLPSASLIEKHRQRVKDIIESLCHKLLDDQALQKLLSQSVESSEMACMQARSNISAAFDELNRAAELRCAELLQHVQENGRQPLSALLAEKERCSAALVDVWCVIDFMEKVNKHGTDVEVLMAKSHLFRDPIGSQKFQEWQNLVAAPLPGFERSRATWREAVQRRLTSRVVRLDATENVIEKAGKAAMCPVAAEYRTIA